MVERATTLLNASPEDVAAAEEQVRSWLLSRSADPEIFFGSLIRQAIDEVLDGPRTGRWDFEQLEKTEKTYVGTKLEILVRNALGLRRGTRLDLEIDGLPVDIKWAMNSSWQFPEEALGYVCLCLGGKQKLRAFQVGVVTCIPSRLNPGQNKDKKRTLSAAGRSAMTMLVPSAELPPNFVAEMEPGVRAAIMAQPSVQKRVTALFRAHPYVPIPRNAIRTIARTEGDPIRRTRADAGRPDPLDGMTVLSAKYGRAELAALGLPPLAADEWVAVPTEELAAE